MVKLLTKKIIWGTILGVSGTIVGGLFLKNRGANKAVETVIEATVEAEKHFGGIPLSKLNEITELSKF